MPATAATSPATRPRSAGSPPSNRSPASCDAAVLYLVLCSLPDRPRALAEIVRVLRPGGLLAFLEHGRGETRGLRVVQRVADATLWPMLAGG